MFISSPSPASYPSPFEAKCKIALALTLLVLSVISLIGGIMALMGTMRVGTVPASLWTGSSGLLAFGLLAYTVWLCARPPAPVFPTIVRSSGFENLAQSEINSLIRDKYVSMDLKDLTPNQFQSLPFDSITKEQLNCIFPPGPEYREVNRRKMALLDHETLIKLITTYRLEFPLQFLSSDQIRNIPFLRIPDENIPHLFPLNDPESRRLSKNRLDGLNPQQLQHVPPDLQNKIRRAASSDGGICHIQ